jgi:hypothetical protein
MTQGEFLRCVQSRTARIAVGASTVRGKGNKGVVREARAYLRTIKLKQFAVPDDAAFRKVLNRHTERLRKRLPKSARRWGIARKVLNIFLRDCLYTGYLAEAYQLRRAEEHFEIPLDSITAKKLNEIAGRGGLPAWPGVRGVTPCLSAEYHLVADQAAEKDGMARVHLDALWWSVARDEIKGRTR